MEAPEKCAYVRYLFVASSATWATYKLDGCFGFHHQFFEEAILVNMKVIIALLVVVALVNADHFGSSSSRRSQRFQASTSRRSGRQFLFNGNPRRFRNGRQDNGAAEIANPDLERAPAAAAAPGDTSSAGGIDFSACETDPETGFCCVEKEETVTSIEKEPILECTHKNVEKCHYTYVTQFEPSQEEVCEENFEKTCQITFNQQAFNETVQKCYRPLTKTCNGQGEEECRTVYESSCSTRYVEKQPGKFVGDTSCEKLPVEICGAGCTTEEGEEECHEKVVTTLFDVPEEICDLNPQKTCRFQTRLVPTLKPKHECTTIPQETCNLRFSNPEPVEKPLKTKWCLDPTPAEPDTTYEETEAEAPVLTETESAAEPQTGYSNPREQPILDIDQPVEAPIVFEEEPAVIRNEPEIFVEEPQIQIQPVVQEPRVAEESSPLPIYSRPQQPVYAGPIFNQDVTNVQQTRTGRRFFTLGR